MSDIFEATAAYLADWDVRDRYEVAIEDGGKGWPATSLGYVRDCPDEVKWLKIEALERRGDAVTVTVGGNRFESGSSYPIVLRAVQS